MTEYMKYSGVYERLVENDRDFLGQIAYSIYKSRKRDFIIRKQAELGVKDLPDEVIAEFVNDQTNYTLELYKSQADNLSREFLNASYGNEIAKEKARLAQEYISKYHKLASNSSFWSGVLQGITASFLFVLSGYIILKMNGIWDIILSNLFK